MSQDADAVLDALGALRAALEASAQDEKVLRERIRRLEEARRFTARWREAVDAEEGGEVLQVLGAIVGRLTAAGAQLRRVLAAALIEEGASTAEVAERFKVSRQRVFRLLHDQARENEGSDRGKAAG
jgi:hypothetical protein